MKFQVPQFIEDEDKMIGGLLTLKQFLIIAGGAGVSFLIFFIANMFVWLFLTTIIGAIVISFAFIKIHGRPLPVVLFSALGYFWNPRLYLWKSKSVPEIKLPTTEKYEYSPTIPLDKTTPEETNEEEPWPKLPEYHPIKTEQANIPAEKPHKAPQTSAVPYTKPEAVKPTRPETKKEPESGLQDRVMDLRKRLVGGGQIQSLWEKITTSKTSLPKREKFASALHKEHKEAEYVTMRRATGEI